MTGLTPDEDITLWVGACRYYVGRQTYAVGDFCNLLIKQWPAIHEHARKIIQRDLEEEFQRDDNARANNDQIRWLGADCDREQWERVRGLWK